MKKIQIVALLIVTALYGSVLNVALATDAPEPSYTVSFDYSKVKTDTDTHGLNIAGTASANPFAGNISDQRVFVDWDDDFDASTHTWVPVDVFSPIQTDQDFTGDFSSHHTYAHLGIVNFSVMVSNGTNDNPEGTYRAVTPVYTLNTKASSEKIVGGGNLCNDGLDNDDDGLTDGDDPDCKIPDPIDPLAPHSLIIVDTNRPSTTSPYFIDIDYPAVNAEQNTHPKELHDIKLMGSFVANPMVGTISDQKIAVDWDEDENYATHNWVPVDTITPDITPYENKFSGKWASSHHYSHLGMFSIFVRFYHGDDVNAGTEGVDRATLPFYISNIGTENSGNIAFVCHDEVDNDDDGLIDANDPGCKPRIRIDLTVDNTGGGTKIVSDFGLSIGSTTLNSGDAVTVDASTTPYKVNVTNTNGYTLTYSPSCDSNGFVLLGVGDLKYCGVKATYTGNPPVQNLIVNNNEGGDGNNGGNGGGGNTPPIVITSFTGGGSGVGGGSGFSLISPDSGEVLGAETTCINGLNSYLGKGKNDPEEVKKLQAFLKEQIDPNLPITGIYGKLTRDAVSKFQVKHAKEILEPWKPFGLKRTDVGTGYFYKTTRYWVNKTLCESSEEKPPMLP